MSYRYIDENGEHLHTWGGKPLVGTSTVTNIIAKPLTWWAAGMALKEFGWVNPKDALREERLVCAEAAVAEIRELDSTQMLQKLDRAYRAHDSVKNKAATKGTDMHAELEAFVKARMLGQEYASDEPAIKTFSKWADENVQEFVWSEVNLYSSDMWVGGISDCGARLKDGKLAIIDFKSSKEAYFGHFVQIGGYAQQFEENGGFTPEGERTHRPQKIDALIVFPFGGGAPRTEYDVEGYERAFVSALNLYKLQQHYNQ